MNSHETIGLYPFNRYAELRINSLVINIVAIVIFLCFNFLFDFNMIVNYVNLNCNIKILGYYYSCYFNVLYFLKMLVQNVNMNV